MIDELIVGRPSGELVLGGVNVYSLGYNVIVNDLGRVTNPINFPFSALISFPSLPPLRNPTDKTARLFHSLHLTRYVYFDVTD